MNELTKTGLELAHRDKFTVPEWVELEKHVKNVLDFDRLRPIAAGSLLTIEKKNLYRAYGSLTEFCVRTFGWSDRRAQQMIASAKLIAGLPEEKRTIVRFESQARELKKYPAEQRVDVLEIASKDGKPTAKAIREVKDKIGEAIDMDGTPIPEGDASYHWRNRSQGEEKLSTIETALAVMREINQNDVMYLECDVPNTIKALIAARHMFQGGLPAYVCPKCKGLKPKECVTCHGRGMIGTWKRKSKAGGKEFLEELQIRTF